MPKYVPDTFIEGLYHREPDPIKDRPLDPPDPPPECPECEGWGLPEGCPECGEIETETEDGE